MLCDAEAAQEGSGLSRQLGKKADDQGLNPSAEEQQQKFSKCGASAPLPYPTQRPCQLSSYLTIPAPVSKSRSGCSALKLDAFVNPLIPILFFKD